MVNLKDIAGNAEEEEEEEEKQNQKNKSITIMRNKTNVHHRPSPSTNRRWTSYLNFFMGLRSWEYQLKIITGITI